jgi:hypothetical protein
MFVFSSADAEARFDVTPEERRQAHLTVVAFLAASVVFLLGSALAVYADRRHDGGNIAPALEDNPVIEGSGQSATSAVIGPDRGAVLATYIADRGKALDNFGADGTGVAVVSFERYATEAEARAAVAGAVEIGALLVAAPGGEPEVVRGSLRDWGVDARDAAGDERQELEKLLASDTIDDPEFADFYAAEVIRLKRLEAALDPEGPVVFGLLVQGPAESLRAIARAPGVRLVDVASGAVDAQADVRGLRPEETERAGEPATRP